VFVIPKDRNRALRPSAGDRIAADCRPNFRSRRRRRLPHLQEKTLPRKDALAKFGIADRPDLRVRVVQSPAGVSMVDVCGPEDPAKTITPNQATELSILLRDAGEETLGQAIAAAAAEAQKINQTT
jgi:hypothetical protein